jgi:hypothetical protein
MEGTPAPPEVAPSGLESTAISGAGGAVVGFEALVDAA